jgi:hypothetical protein
MGESIGSVFSTPTTTEEHVEAPEAPQEAPQEAPAAEQPPAV